MSHERHWGWHPRVRAGSELTLGERAADSMKATLATWPALGGIVVAILAWIATSGFGLDRAPYILLNLCLSCLAALQCFVLLIAAKRADAIASEIAKHTEQNTEDLKALLAQNTALTEQVAKLAQAIHDHVTIPQPLLTVPPPPKPPAIRRTLRP